MIWTTRQRSDFGALAAVAEGAGPLVLLIHGVGLRSEAWQHQARALAPRFRTLAVDMPGHGESPAPTGPLALPDYTDVIAAALAGPALVVGHSMGAMIALDMAHRFPEKVRGVAALNAIYRRGASAAKAVQARADALDGLTAPDPAPTLERWFGDTPSPERQACRDWLNAVDPAAYKMAYSAFAAGDAPDDAALAALACPALFVTGALEPNSTPRMSRAMAARVPNGRAIIIEGAAHMMPMTHPDAVNAVLSDFARQVWS